MARWIGCAIVIFFIIAVVWACIGHVNVVAEAKGKIVPSSHVKTIQPLEIGIVRRIHVDEGDEVDKGQLLIELDPTTAGADRSALRDQLVSLRAERSRLKTLLMALDSDQPMTMESLARARPEQDWYAWPDGATRQQAILQRQRLWSQVDRYRSQIDALEEDRKQKLAELAATNKRIAKLEATIPLVTERTSSLEQLVSKNMAPRMDWLSAEETRIEQVRERQIQMSNRQNVKAAIAAIEERRQAFRAEFEQKRLDKLNETENRIQSVRQELVKAEERLSQQQLRAPVAGTVDQMEVNTVGGVVKPAQKMMTIVPEDDPLAVESWIQNKDIGFVSVGQPAEIKVNTFQFTKYGTIAGEIVNISHDAVEDEKRGLVYKTRIKPEKTTMQVNGKEIKLSSGMAISAEVNIGERRLIEYILTPLLRYKNESLKER